MDSNRSYNQRAQQTSGLEDFSLRKWEEDGKFFLSIGGDGSYAPWDPDGSDLGMGSSMSITRFDTAVEREYYCQLLQLNRALASANRTSADCLALLRQLGTVRGAWRNLREAVVQSLRKDTRRQAVERSFGGADE